MDTPADANNAPLVLGWEEWLALPDLGLHAMKAKVDTGAKTSALHATNIESFGSKDKQKVRFVVHPDPERRKRKAVCHPRSRTVWRTRLAHRNHPHRSQKHGLPHAARPPSLP